MKTKTKIYSLLACVFLTQAAKTQFLYNLGNFGQTAPAIRGIGIGDFSTNGVSSTNSRLHVNNFYCNQPTGTLNGLLFRTDGSSQIDPKIPVKGLVD